ncbi:NADH-quinone oxidoreductase subunit C [Hazenella coriacea]|uniref:NADH-quinone oxidoreductase subunit C n=1 Tax=Hazenella coriacea TaxID=1179467 RepID=A0A4R3L930_9BACL|nr:NADH-quinone oxidoreductase subunit C [Hazenella coriacea]TCS95600.1 NADH-quinone oxidoreductase subunit C [Hazenella coriacea]
MSEKEDRRQAEDEQTRKSQLPTAGVDPTSKEGINKEATSKASTGSNLEKEGQKEVAPKKSEDVKSKPTDTSGSTEKKPVASNRARPVGAARPRPSAKKEEKPLEPSPKQPILDQWVEKVKQRVAPEAVAEAYINRPTDHSPTMVIKKEYWLPLATLLKEEADWKFDFLRNLSGVDYETHFEIVYHFISLVHEHEIGIRVKIDRDEASVPTVSEIWKAANWNEREVYDLLGIHFEGHPNLKRILMPDDWVGYPLRKDYEPLDKEV